MRELAILTFVTLDGVMQAPGQASEDRSGNFQHAGWARPYWDDVDGAGRQNRDGGDLRPVAGTNDI